MVVGGDGGVVTSLLLLSVSSRFSVYTPKTFQWFNQIGSLGFNPSFIPTTKGRANRVLVARL